MKILDNPDVEILMGHCVDRDTVIQRLEEAGATLLALPSADRTTRLRMSFTEIVRTTLENYGWTETRIPARATVAAPSVRAVARMDEAMGWIAHIPLDRYVLRRIVGARSLVHPVTHRHCFHGGASSPR
jgi:hypothetical protein